MRGLFALLVGILILGCSAVMEVGQSQLEVPTLEAQLNRVAVGLGVIRENNILLAMPISADAKWPEAIGADVTPTEQRLIRRALKKDPYYATHTYTDLVQMKMLGGYFVSPVSPLAERAFKRVLVLYGEDAGNWPTFFSFKGGIGQLTVFQDGTLKSVDAITANSYPGLEAALTALMPTAYQKEIETALHERSRAREQVALLKEKKAIVESREQLESSDTQDRYTVNEQIAVLNVQISRAETVASEKEAIVETVLEQAESALQSDLRLDREQVALAKNILRVCDTIQTGAMEAGTLFSIALGNITLRDMLQRFPEEMKSLAIATASVPGHLRGVYANRVERLAENALYLLPSIAVGSYEAFVQVSDSSRYAQIASIIVEADKVRQEQNGE